jgi:hypothetical protein
MVYYYNRWRETSKIGTSPYFYAADFSLNSFKVNRLEGFPTVCYSLNGRSVAFQCTASTSRGEGGSSWRYASSAA